MKSSSKIMRKIIVFIIVLLLIPFTAIADLTVYFLDVGQGDCAIIECDGEVMIIDGGLPGQPDKLFNFIDKDLRYDRIAYMVATHPDNDHIGGLPDVFEAAKKAGKKVMHLYSPVKDYDSPEFLALEKKANENNVRIKVPYDDQKEYLGSATIIFYNCGHERKGVVRSATGWFKSLFIRDEPEEIKENNDMSLVVKLVYKDTSFLFTGDIEKDAEARLISSNIELKSDVIKIAHHGSNSSSSFDFLDKVNPKYAIISCGEGNRYGHPHQETLDELKLQNVELYRTDLQGKITCRSDGHSITFETEKRKKSDVFSAPQKSSQ